MRRQGRSGGSRRINANGSCAATRLRCTGCRRRSRLCQVNSRPQFDVTDLVREYDKLWSTLDFVGLADLWERDDPQPIYVGDEYAAPLIGTDDLDRHWARV